MEEVREAEQYQVFISHRGPDTKTNIASLIYHALVPYGLQVFLDQDELCTGDIVEPEIQRAINSASVHIAIFSPRYAESHWCLKELCWMLRSAQKRKVIPIFCDVEPWELRYIEKGCYAHAFRKHEERAYMDVVKGWKDALKEAADIKGLVFKTKQSDQGKFLSEIENTVMKHVKWYAFEVATYSVGVDQAWKDMENQIQKQSSTKVVLIAGIGGMGKSTLATHVFNLKRSEFNRVCYLFNVREQVDLTTLQRKLLCELRGKDVEIPNTNIGKTILRRSLRGLKVLIVLDDVDDKEKIKSVLDINALEPGSLIFITSRSKDILGASSAHTLLYDVKPLKRYHARQLFCHHAFRQLNPLEGYGDLVEQFLEICGGVPLCLEVLGQQVSGKLDKTHWEKHLKNFSQGKLLTELDPVINTLKWSYQTMGIEQQKILLDVGCFFVGEDLELAVRVLEGLDYLSDVQNCLESLRQKCLVDFSKDIVEYEVEKQRQDIAFRMEKKVILPAVLPRRGSKIIMQNQVRELARRIASEDLQTVDKPLRLSCSIDIEKMSQFQSGSVSCRIRGICIRKEQTPPQLPMNIRNMCGIKILVVEHAIDASWFLGLSGELVWLRCRNCPLISLPPTLSLRSLRVLELQAPKDDLLEEFFNSIDEMPFELRVLDIDLREEAGASSSSSSSAQRVDLQHFSKAFDRDIPPNFFRRYIPTNWQSVMPYFSRFLQSIGSLMKNLTKIVLKGVIDAQSLPFDFSELKNLTHLDLSGSTRLTTLPNSFSQLLQLQHLALRGCINLYIPMDILGEISTLEHIDFKGCTQLVHLPEGIASQRHLRYLNLLNTSLVNLPLNLKLLCDLEQLAIGSERLKELPCLVQLKELILVQCFKLKHISTPIEQLTCLERLEIYGSNVPILPAGISMLKHLKVLTICRCTVGKIDFDNNAMDALTDLTLIYTSIPGITIPAGACPRLEIVDLSHNYRLSDVQLSQSTLVKLNLHGCANLLHMNLRNLGSLKFLNIKRCAYVEIQNVVRCQSLEEIRAEGCLFTIEAGWSQLELPAWSQLERLNFFMFSQDFDNFSMRRWPKYSQSSNKMMAVMEFEKLLNSFHDARLLEVPSTATDESPLLVNNVHSHSAILMCFLSNRKHDDPWSAKENKFIVRFEACNSGAQYEVFETHPENSDKSWIHMYMWTRRSRLFTDEDHFYDNVSIYKQGVLDVEGGERGWILTFSSENHVLHVCNQIINHSAEVE